MGYTSGSKTLPDILEDIANGLIASAGGYWTNITSYDSGATAWTTTTKTGDSAKRALRYVNGSEEIFLSMTVTNTYRTFYPSWYTKGLEVVFSASWDSVNHTFPSSNQKSHIPIENVSSAGVSTDMATLQIQYYLWVESNGFVITGKPEPTGSNQQQSFFMFVERNPNKEWSDGQSNFYFFNVTNNYGCMFGWDYGNAKQRGIMRPFAYVWPPDGYGNATWTPAQVVGSGYGVNGIPTPSYFAFKSNVGTGKVYYVKPILNNTSGSSNPIFQSELWFPWSEGVGLIDGDVIAIEGQTTKFLCKAVDSPDYTTRLCYAIKYVA
jgi:hypothetical protein